MKKKIVYVNTRGSEDLEVSYALFLLASAAISMEMEASIYFLGRGVTILKRGVAEKLELVGFPPLIQVMEQAVEVGVVVEACEQSCMLMGLMESEVLDYVQIVGATTLNDRVLEADSVLSF